MKIIKQDILKIKKGIICHQVNAQSVMGAGLATKIKSKWPDAYNIYMVAYESGIINLGGTQMAKVGDDLFVFNLVAQDKYGTKGCFTNYKALRVALKEVAKFRKEDLLEPLPVYIPYKMGCGLAGGDWNIVSKIIQQKIPDAIICKI